MGTGIFRQLFAAAIAVGFVCAGCGGGAGGSRVRTPGGSPSDFAGLVGESAPGDWHSAKIPTGAVLYFPSGWRRARGDVGTATAVLLDDRHRIAGYLNVTPRQGSETLSDWPVFRVRHNRQEGNREVATEGFAYGLRFRNGTGTCVRDRYRTASDARYVEIACLVRGAAEGSVIVAAAPPSAWLRVSPILYRALSAFTS